MGLRAQPCNEKKKKKKHTMDIFATFASDEKAELAGQWFPLSKTAKVLVARAGNTNYVVALRKTIEKNQMDLSAGSAESEQLAEQALVDVMSSTILLGWEGLSFQGKSVDYSVEMAKTMLRVKDFRKKISGFSDSFEAFRVKAEVEQGNA